MNEMNLVQVGLRLPDDMIHALKIEALNQKTTMKELITQAVRDLLAKQQSGE
jgi:hypothetical protein